MRHWWKWGAALIMGAVGGYWLAQRDKVAHRTTSDRQRRVDYRQIEALMAVRDVLALRAPLPPMRGYAISPDFALILLEIIRDYRPTHLMELGCGVSTLIGSYGLEKYHPHGHITSIEHQAAFADFTRDNLTKHGLTDFVTVIHAPLTMLYRVHGWRGRWYASESIGGDKPIDLLVIDGPPQYQNPQRLARYPALPLLFDRLAAGALILVDDADRRGERRAVKRWLREFPLREIRRFDTEKGTVLLQKC